MSDFPNGWQDREASHTPWRMTTTRTLEASVADMVNHPKHYKGHPSGIECFAVAKHLNMPIGTAFKYVYRFEDKWDPTEDLEKAIWYVEHAPTAEPWQTGANDLGVIRDVHAMVEEDYATGRAACVERARFNLAVLAGDRLKMLSALRALIAIQKAAQGKPVVENIYVSDVDTTAAEATARAMRRGLK